MPLGEAVVAGKAQMVGKAAKFLVSHSGDAVVALGAATEVVKAAGKLIKETKPVLEEAGIDTAEVAEKAKAGAKKAAGAAKELGGKAGNAAVKAAGKAGTAVKRGANKAGDAAKAAAGAAAAKAARKAGSAAKDARGRFGRKAKSKTALPNYYGPLEVEYTIEDIDDEAGL